MPACGHELFFGARRIEKLAMRKNILVTVVPREGVSKREQGNETCSILSLLSLRFKSWGCAAAVASRWPCAKEVLTSCVMSLRSMNCPLVIPTVTRTKVDYDTTTTVCTVSYHTFFRFCNCMVANPRFIGPGMYRVQMAMHHTVFNGYVLKSQYTIHNTQTQMTYLCVCVLFKSRNHKHKPLTNANNTFNVL
jgi:hypothetical protein